MLSALFNQRAGWYNLVPRNFRSHKHFPLTHLLLSVALKFIGTKWIFSLFDLIEERDSLAWSHTDVERTKDAKAGLPALHPGLSATSGFLLHSNSEFLSLHETPASVLTLRPQIVGLGFLPHLCFLKGFWAALTPPLNHSLFHLLLFWPCLWGHTPVGQHLKIRITKGPKGHSPEKPCLPFSDFCEKSFHMLSRGAGQGGKPPFPSTEPPCFCWMTCIHWWGNEEAAWCEAAWFGLFAQGHCAQRKDLSVPTGKKIRNAKARGNKKKPEHNQSQGLRKNLCTGCGWGVGGEGEGEGVKEWGWGSSEKITPMGSWGQRAWLALLRSSLRILSLLCLPSGCLQFCPATTRSPPSSG